MGKASKPTVTTRVMNGMEAFSEKDWAKKRKREKNARKQRKVNRKK